MVKIGDSVIYVPKHIQTQNMNEFNFTNSLCEYGIIKSINERFIFVNYVINGIIQNTAKATDPNDLFFLDGSPIINMIDISKSLQNIRDENN